MELTAFPKPVLRVALETLGCKLNLADTELLIESFLRAGFQVVSPDETAEVYVVNTCTVTHVADRKARQRLRAARRRIPTTYLVATGCYPQRAPSELTAMPEVDLVVGNTDKARLVELVVQGVQQRLSQLAFTFIEHAPEEDLPPRAVTAPSRVRSFVKIQEGCNDFCSYCIIPKTRGASRYFSEEAIITAINERSEAGVQEVVLTGTQLGDYGITLSGPRRAGPDQRDQASEGNPLAQLLSRILRETIVPRIRVSSLQPQDITPELLERWEDSRLCRHFHLPLQSGTDSVLKAMRRRYTAQEYAQAVERIRAPYPDASITTDILTGFPGESEADFEATYQLCTDLQFADMHIFPYSPRPSTLATRLPNPVSEAVKEERLQRLLRLADLSREQHLQRFVGTVRPVLWEEVKATAGVSNGPACHGLTDNYLRVYAPGDPQLIGTVRATRIERSVTQGLWGEVLL